MLRGHLGRRATLVLVLGLSSSIHLNATSEKGAAVEALAGDASGAPAEFAADLLIRIAQSPNIDDPARKRELLEAAFMRAYGAQEPYKRLAPTVPLDSDAGSVTRARATGLDTLTLQLRAVAGLVPIDARRARELFEWIEFYLPPATCDAALVPVVDEYYATLATIARRTFDNTVEGHAEALRFFGIYLWRTHLPSEIPAVVRAVKAMRLSRVEAGYFEEALSAIVDHTDSDARGFSTYGLEIVQRMSDLADSDRIAGVFGEPLMRAQRRLLVAQLSTSRCSDSVAETPIAETFNTIVRRRGFTPDLVAPLTAADVWPVKVLGAAAAGPYWQTVDARRLLLGLLQLRDLAAGRRAVLVKRTTEWQAAAQEYLLDLELWNGSHDPEREYFDQKSLLYDLYLDVVPPGALRARAVRSFVDFLRRSDTGRLPRELWFANVKRLLDRGDGATVPAMEQSGHHLLSIYASAERLLANNRRGP
jgi:hypothetical protein